MKKHLFRVIIFFLFLTSAVMTLAQSVSIQKADLYNDNRFFRQRTPRQRDLRGLAPSTGGVAFTSIAEPEGNAVGQPLSLRYDPDHNTKDGERLKVFIGNNVINSELFDWELVPLTRYVEVDSWACVSLLGGADEGDSLKLFEEALDILGLRRGVDNVEAFRKYAIKDSAFEEKENELIDLELEYDALVRSINALVHDINNDLSSPLRRSMETRYRSMLANLNSMEANHRSMKADFDSMATDLNTEKEKLSPSTQKAVDSFDESVFWASYNPAFGNTPVGLNLLLVDAMFVGGFNRVTWQRINEFVSRLTLPGYNNRSANQEPSVELLRNLRRGGTERKNILEPDWYWETYIFSDAGVPITYHISGGKIEFKGSPYYQFMRENLEPSQNQRWLYEYAVALNTYMSEETTIAAVRRLNPAVYDAAERWCRWSALFRAVKENNPDTWKNFLNSVNSKYPGAPNTPGYYPEPRYETPRIWIPSFSFGTPRAF